MSIQANYSTSKEYEVIEYPGKVVNIEKAINTLGGIDRISQTFCGHMKRLELRYHPDNPFNKALCGDENEGDGGLVLSVKVKRSKRNPQKPPKYEVTIVGSFNRIYTFNSLCDYQYLPICVDPVDKKLKCMTDKLIPKSILDTEYFMNENVPLFGLPFQFAKLDVVYTDILRTSDINESGQHQTLGVLQKTLYGTETVNFSMTEPLPSQGDSEVVKRMIVKYVSDEQFNNVKKLFEKCPIWTRVALCYESGVSIEKLKSIIPCLAFHFVSGPWRSLFVRYGYDPRKDFKSRYYQTFDFRLRLRSGVAEMVPHRKDLMRLKQENSELNVLLQDVDYPYLKPDKLPRSRQCIFRYCDVHFPKVQIMVENIQSPSAGGMCSERSGWLPSGFDSTIRQIVSHSIKKLLQNHYRKERGQFEGDSLVPIVQGVDEEGADIEDIEDQDDEDYIFELQQFEGTDMNSLLDD